MATDYFQARALLRTARHLMQGALSQLPPASVAYTRVLDVQIALDTAVENVVPKGDLPPVLLVHGIEYVRKDRAARSA